MEKQEIINQAAQILSKKDAKSIEKTLEFIVSLSEIAQYYNAPHFMNAFENFVNYETLNYLCDEKLSKADLKFWSKERILNWAEKMPNVQLNLPNYYNVNALVLAMNYEYEVHKDYVDSVGEQKAMTAYSLATGALKRQGYIDEVLKSYQKK